MDTQSTETLEGPRPQRIRSDDQLVVHALQGRSERLVISFAGVGSDRNQTPPREFYRAASEEGENNVLFVSDRTRSWLNGPGIAEAIVALIEGFRAARSITEVVALGNSMGGFAAIRLAELTQVDTVIALSPQFSANPETVPEETRWKLYRNRITDWPHPTVGALDREETMYFLFHGDAPEEAAHWSRFPWHGGLHHFIFAGQDHNVARQMKSAHVFKPVIQAAMQRKPRRVRKLLERGFDGAERGVYRREAYAEAFGAEAAGLQDRLAPVV